MSFKTVRLTAIHSGSKRTISNRGGLGLLRTNKHSDSAFVSTPVKVLTYPFHLTRKKQNYFTFLFIPKRSNHTITWEILLHQKDESLQYNLQKMLIKSSKTQYHNVSCKSLKTDINLDTIN